MHRSGRTPVSILVLLCCALLWGCSTAPRRQVADQGPGLVDEEDEFNHGELENLLDYDPADTEPRMEGVETDAYDRFKENLRRDHRLGYMVEMAPILQQGAGEWHGDQETNLIAQWTPYSDDSGDKGELLGWYQYGSKIGGRTASDFQSDVGTLAPLNGGTPNNRHDVLQHLAWEQTSGNWRFMLGKITSRITFNTNRYTTSDREDFFSPMIVNNPVSTYTARNGLGFFAQHSQDTWYASGMVRDADATNTGIDFDSLSSDKWEQLLEVGLSPEFEGLGEGVYRVTWGHTDSIGSGGSRVRSGSSFAISADQDLGEDLGCFVRYAWADRGLRDFDSRLAAGLQVIGPFEHPDDRWGLAFWSAHPTKNSLDREQAVETYYRVQLTPRTQVSVDVQTIFDPANKPQKDVRVVSGLRLRVVF